MSASEPPGEEIGPSPPSPTPRTTPHRQDSSHYSGSPVSRDRTNPISRVVRSLLSLVEEIIETIPKTKKAGCKAFSHWLWDLRRKMRLKPSGLRCFPAHRCVDALRSLFDTISLFRTYMNHLRASLGGALPTDDSMRKAFANAVSRLDSSGANVTNLQSGINLDAQRARMHAFIDGQGPDPSGRQRRNLVEIYDGLSQYFDEFKATLNRSGFTTDATNRFVETILNYEVRVLEVMIDKETEPTSTT